MGFGPLFLILHLIWGAGTAAALTKSEENTVRVFQQVAPGVVNITTTAVAYDFFFNPYPMEGSGSGFIVTEEGHIVTNLHVVRDQAELEVTLADGSKWPARVVGKAPASDLALIKIEAPRAAMKPLTLGSSTGVQVGHKVLAVGSPFGLGHTLTTGTVSSVGRDVRISRDVVIRGAIQTNAAINPGNSGGPLINSEGEVIGVNTAIFSPTGANVGVGFAIPSETVRQLLPGLVSPWPRVASWVLAAVLVGSFIWWLRRRFQRDEG
ncbi:MAG TPA: trypsin-like peptidase domain-containing protein [Syntrophobacteria bacterium]|nr:trypsin-like peptidase domain-containing protein [Syntrophobacteria bacterium]